MTEQLLKETKTKIIDVARVLFSENGYEGTSIREIAKNAHVNIAAINYHFGSKEQLFVQIIQNSTSIISTSLGEIYNLHLAKKNSAEDFFIDVFRFFKEHGSDIVSTMKVMMSFTMKQKSELGQIKEIEKGPPGAEYFAMVIKEVIKKEISEDNLQWATTAIFSHITHKTIIIHTCISEADKQNPLKFCSEQDFENGLRKLVKAIFLYLNQN